MKQILYAFLITLILAGCKPSDDTTAQVFGDGAAVTAQDSKGRIYMIVWTGNDWLVRVIKEPRP